ncbi:MAG: hypothetical protein QXQ28_05670 [Candidatus Nezhaarchaeales archaeon]
MWDYILGGATVFGAIVALAAWYNGRMTRRFLAELIVKEGEATRELIAKMDEHLTKMDERFAKMDERFAKMDERFAKMDERFEALLKSLEAYAKASLTQHAEILQAVKGGKTSNP